MGHVERSAERRHGADPERAGVPAVPATTCGPAPLMDDRWEWRGGRSEAGTKEGGVCEWSHRPRPTFKNVAQLALKSVCLHLVDNLLTTTLVSLSHNLAQAIH